MALATASLAKEHEVVLTHGNGPQVGELAPSARARRSTCSAPGRARSATSSRAPNRSRRHRADRDADAVDAADPAFNTPTKFVGPVYGAKEAEASWQLDWTVKQDGEYYAWAVPSPRPRDPAARRRARAARVAANVLVVACGGGGAVSRVFGDIVGVEAVIDKDMTGASRGAGANGLIILTDGGGIWENFGKPNAREMKRVTPAYLTGVKAGAKFPGSMGPKITAAIDFVVHSERPDAWAAIADLKDAAKVFTNEEGTMISKDIGGGDVNCTRGHRRIRRRPRKTAQTPSRNRRPPGRRLLSERRGFAVREPTKAGTGARPRGHQAAVEPASLPRSDRRRRARRAGTYRTSFQYRIVGKRQASSVQSWWRRDVVNVRLSRSAMCSS